MQDYTFEQSEDQALIDQYAALALAAGLDPMEDVGEMIHDVADHFGCSAANNVDDGDEDQADQELDMWSQAGSDINNCGLHEQIAVLLAFHGESGLAELLRPT